MAVQSRYPTYLADQTQFFDELITEDRDTYLSEAWDASRRCEVRALFHRVQPARILDIGCGCGFHDAEMASYPFVERVDAIDPSTKSIAFAEERYRHPKVERWTAGLADLPDSHFYDLVVSFQVFEHLADPDAYLAKLRELLRAGGRAAIITPNRLRLDNRLRVWRGEPEVLIDPMHFCEYTRDELATLALRHSLCEIAAFGLDLQIIGSPWMARVPAGVRSALGSAFPTWAHLIGIVLAPS